MTSTAPETETETKKINFVYEEFDADRRGVETREQTVLFNKSDTFGRVKQSACFWLGIQEEICLWITNREGARVIDMDDEEPISEIFAHNQVLRVERTGRIKERLQETCLRIEASEGTTSDEQVASALSGDFKNSGGTKKDSPCTDWDEELAKLLSIDLNGTNSNHERLYDPRGAPRSSTNIVAEGSCSQFAIEGGRSACTAICLYAASRLLQLIHKTPLAITTETLDSIVQVGTILYHDLGFRNEHVGIDDIWQATTFSDLICYLSRGDILSGMSSFEGFQEGLAAAVSFAGSLDKNSVAMVITKPPETVLVICKDTQSGGPWFMFDSHGQSKEPTKRAYIKQLDSIECTVHALLEKFPIVEGLEDSLGAQLLNMFELHPIVFNHHYNPCGAAVGTRNPKPTAPVENTFEVLKEGDQPTATTVSSSKTASSHLSENIIDHFRDPTMGLIFADPVICDRGHTHERTVIEKWFESRREEKAKEEEREEQQGGNETDCCNRKSNYDPTCPSSGEPISEILIESQQCERLVIAFIESGAIQLDDDELHEWRTRRAEKAKRIEARRAEEQKQRHQAAQLPEREEPLVTKDTVRVERPVFGELSQGAVDLGLSVALRPSNWRRPNNAVPSRCSNLCCRSLLSPQSQAACERCALFHCTSCLSFRVTEAARQGEGSGSSHLICPECTHQITNALAGDGWYPERVAELDSLLNSFFDGLTVRMSRTQHQIVRRQKHLELLDSAKALHTEIRRLRETQDTLERDIKMANTQAERARCDDGGVVEATAARVVSEERETELMTKCMELQREHDELEGRGVADGEDELQYAIRLSVLQNQFRSVSAELVQVREARAASATAPREQSPAEARADELLEQIVATEKEYDELESKGPSSEHDMDFALRLNALQFQYETLTSELIQVRESIPRDKRETTPEDRKHRKSFPFRLLRHVVRRKRRPGKQKAPESELRACATEAPRDGKHPKASHRPAPESKLQAEATAAPSDEEKMPASRASTQPAPVDQPVLPESFLDDEDDVSVASAESVAIMISDLSAINQDDNSSALELPLGLVFPSPRARNRLLLMRNALEQERLQSEQQLDELFVKRRTALEQERDRLEDSIAVAKRNVADAKASAEEEERRKQERLRRRQEVEEARLNNERKRASEAARIRQEKERLERVRREQEQQTRDLLKGKDLRICGNCGFGPFERYNCMDMAAHNDKIHYMDKEGRRRQRGRNDCPECGWTHSDWRQWPKFQG